MILWTGIWGRDRSHNKVYLVSLSPMPRFTQMRAVVALQINLTVGGKI
jgi:hypothetical protein